MTSHRNVTYVTLVHTVLPVLQIVLAFLFFTSHRDKGADLARRQFQIPNTCNTGNVAQTTHSATTGQAFRRVCGVV
eukprot:3870848-Amphidinium_carterae.1